MGLLLSKLSNLFDGFADNPVRIVILGLDAAGKTTIMYKLKLNERVTTIPTIGSNVDTITPMKGLTCAEWQVGGHSHTRILAYWNHYFPNIQGLIYVVDSNDRDRFDEAVTGLQDVLEVPAIAGVPVVVLANKQDLPHAASCGQVAEAMDLHELQDRKWHVQGTCGTNGVGLYEAVDVLATLIKEFKKSQRSY